MASSAELAAAAPAMADAAATPAAVDVAAATAPAAAAAAAGAGAASDLAGWDDVLRLVKSKGSFDVSLKDAVQGGVVTRFPPEPSGYLHIGHCKAALLNAYFAAKYAGRLVVRFDDTNPSNENAGFEAAIVEDLARVGIVPHTVEYTSDYFPQLLTVARSFIEAGKAYVDPTEVEEMRRQRMAKENSPYRDAPVADSLRLWEEMLAGTPEGIKCCLRAKIDMRHKIGSMRDPIMVRGNAAPHHRTGDKYKVYPTYDFSCPVVDSLSGVTHALRSSEYSDRVKQYQWFCNAAAVRVPSVWDFARLNFVYVLMSKRKLQALVDTGVADGWDDPRFPTVRGLMRRGLTVPALRAFILSQGASRSATLMEWDKIWTVNKRVLDPVSPRHVAIGADPTAPAMLMTVSGAVEEIRSVPRHKKNLSLGDKPVLYGPQVWVEAADAAAMKVGERVTLMDWGNVHIDTVPGPDGGDLTATFLPDDQDFKGTVKVTWLAAVEDLVPLRLVSYGHLLTKPKLDEGDAVDDFLNRDSRHESPALGDINLRGVQKGEVVQLERRGFFICDRVHLRDDAAAPMTLIEIPDGKAKK